MLFQHNTQFDAGFDAIPDIVWYPYVGRDFGRESKRIMVFGHNMPIEAARFEAKTKEWTPRSTWANSMEEFAYEPRDYTKAYRSFFQAAVGLSEPYYATSSPAITDRVNSFIRRIAFTNFIQGVVKSETPLAKANDAMVDRSRQINRCILDTLGITHCICWGKNVYDYVTTLDGVRVVHSEPLPKRGFAYALAEDRCGRRMHLLKVFHPSMPRFGCRSLSTQEAFSSFLSKRSE